MSISNCFSTIVCFRLLMFCSSKKDLFSWAYLLKKTPRRTIIFISPVWNKILKIWGIVFELIQIGGQCRKNYLKNILPQEDGAFGNNIEKEPQKPRPKLKNYVYYIFTKNICFACSTVQLAVSLQKCINFVEQRVKFSQTLSIFWGWEIHEQKDWLNSNDDIYASLKTFTTERPKHRQVIFCDVIGCSIAVCIFILL